MTDKFDPATHKFGMAFRNPQQEVVYPMLEDPKCKDWYVCFRPDAVEPLGNYPMLHSAELTRAPEHDLVPRQAVTGDDKPCRHFKDYKAIYPPKCKCKPCHDKYAAIPAQPTDKDAMEALEFVQLLREKLLAQLLDEKTDQATIEKRFKYTDIIRRALSAPAREGKLVEALRQIKACVDNQNPAHEQIWHIAYNVLAAHDKETR